MMATFQSLPLDFYQHDPLRQVEDTPQGPFLRHATLLLFRSKTLPRTLAFVLRDETHP